MLSRIKLILGPFFQATKRVEGNTVEWRSYGALWEVLVSLECLIQRLEEQQIILSNDLGNRYLSVCVGWALKKLTDYVGKTTRAPVWLAFLVLHPSFKWANLDTLDNIERIVQFMGHHVWEFRHYGLVPIKTKFPLLKKLRTQTYTILSTKKMTSFKGLHIPRQHMDKILSWKISIWDISPKLLKKTLETLSSSGVIISLLILISHE